MSQASRSQRRRGRRCQWQKEAPAQTEAKIDREQIRILDKCGLPDDLIFKGHANIIVLSRPGLTLCSLLFYPLSFLLFTFSGRQAARDFFAERICFLI
jgi:hypothetical protein